MKKLSVAALFSVAAVCAPAPASARAQEPLTLLTDFAANQGAGTSAGEITAFDPGSGRLFVTSSSAFAGPSAANVFQVNVFGLGNPASASALGTIDFSTAFGTAAEMRALSSVAVDPLRRFGVATLIPTANATTPGRVGFFNLATGAVIGTANVGFHPDSVTFSADGSRMIVVNEGEFNANTATADTGNAGTNPTNANAPGSISIFNLGGINAGNLGTLPSLTANTRDFSAGNLAAGVSIAGLRNSNLAAVGTAGLFNQNVPVFNTAAPEAIEPEFATVRGDKVFISLQDNNAIAEFDLVTNQYTAVTNLGTITRTLDASDQDGGINVTQTVKGLPMPDTVASYSANGRTFVVSANEGDARNDNRDISRFGDVAGNDSMNGLIDQDAPSNFPNTATGIRAPGALGRLNLSRIDGDTDGDAKIDDPTALGTRSMTVWEQTAGGLVRVGDTGSFLETYLRDFDAPGFVDGRSDDKGPEPEGLTLGSIDGVTYAFLSLERQNGIFMFDLSDPTNPRFVDYFRIGDGVNDPARPEGMLFVPAVDSPNGQNLLIVGFEGDGTNAANERVAIFAVVPEPGTWALLGVGGTALVAGAVRQRRRARPMA